jgi:hypothetical protein
MLNRKFIIYCLIEDHVVKMKWSHVGNARVESGSLSRMKKINVDANLTCSVGECLKLQWMDVEKHIHTATGWERDLAWYSWADNILHFVYVKIYTSIFYRPQSHNLSKFIFNLSPKLRIIINFTKVVTTRGFFEMHLPGESKVWFNSF